MFIYCDINTYTKMLLDFRNAKNHSPSGSCFCYGTSRVFISQYINMHGNHFIFLKCIVYLLYRTSNYFKLSYDKAKYSFSIFSTLELFCHLFTFGFQINFLKRSTYFNYSKDQDHFLGGAYMEEDQCSWQGQPSMAIEIPRLS